MVELMSEPEKMVSWQVTATTVHCEEVDDEVTLLVYKGWSVKCTGQKKYSNPDKDTTSLMKKKSRQSKRLLSCKGLECSRITQYKNKLVAEEGKAKK